MTGSLTGEVGSKLNSPMASLIEIMHLVFRAPQSDAGLNRAQICCPIHSHRRKNALCAEERIPTWVRSPARRVDTLELAFDTKSLRNICENQAQAKHALGSQVAEFLKHRLADLRAAASPRDLVAGHPRELTGADRQNMAVDLREGYRIVFTANHNKNPMTDTGHLDWSRVSRVKILRIEVSNG